MQTVTVSVQNQKRALELKYLLQLPSEQNEPDLLNILNKIPPFTDYPLHAVPPIELIETDAPLQNSGKDSRQIKEEQKVVSSCLREEIKKHSYLIITGGLVIKKGQHRFIQNKFVGPGIEEEIFFNILEGDVTLYSLPGSCYLRIHNIWIQKAKKRHKTDTQQYIKNKLMQVPFFAALTFPEFQKCYKAAYLKVLGPKDVLVKAGETPYNMYIVGEGQLTFQKTVSLLKDDQLWMDVKNQLQRQDDKTCQQMFEYLVKQPKPHEKSFEVIFKIKSVSQREIICAKETLCEQPLTYEIVSTLKTKLICLKYPDFYYLDGERLAEIRSWESFGRADEDLRRDFYYQIKWSQFKEETKRESQLNKIEKQRFQDFLRKNVDLNIEKAYYFPNKVGQGNIIGNPAGKVSKLKAMSYTSGGKE